MASPFAVSPLSFPPSLEGVNRDPLLESEHAVGISCKCPTHELIQSHVAIGALDEQLRLLVYSPETLDYAHLVVSGTSEPPGLLLQGPVRRFASVLRHHAGWLSALALVAFAGLSLWPVLHRPGWPLNHEGHVWATRAGVLDAAWQRGEWFPLWWEEGNLGLGSPMPALYHKLHNYVCTLLLQVFGDIKAAQVASLLLFSFVGCFGTLNLSLQLGAPRLAALALAAALPFTEYVTADWLVRGAFAEHTAFMLLPWLLLVLLRTIASGRVVGLQLAGILTLLFYAHSMTALYAGALVSIALIFALARHRSRAKHILLNAALAGAAFLMAAAPALWIMRVMTRHVYLAHATQGYYVVQRHLTSLVNALFVGEAPTVGFRVAPDNAFWVALAVASALVLHPRSRAARNSIRVDAELAFLLSATALMIFLRLTPAALVYEVIPGLKYIQFPWRLLSFTTVLLLALCAWLAARLEPALANAASLVLLFVLMATGRVFRFDEKVWLEADKVSAALAPTTYIRWIEYLPAVPGPAHPRQLQAWTRGPQVLRGSCELNQVAPKAVVAQCSTASTVALPHAFSGLELVTSAGRVLHTHRTDRDPRVLVDLPAGTTELQYRAPGWATALRHLMQ